MRYYLLCDHEEHGPESILIHHDAEEFKLLAREWCGVNHGWKLNEDELAILDNAVDGTRDWDNGEYLSPPPSWGGAKLFIMEGE